MFKKSVSVILGELALHCAVYSLSQNRSVHRAEGTLFISSMNTQEKPN